MNDFLTHSQLIGKFTDNELTHEEETSLLYQASRNPLLRNELRLDRDISEMFADQERIILSETIRKVIRNERGRIIIPFSVKIAASLIILITLGCLMGILMNFQHQNYGNALVSCEPIIKPKSPGFLSFLHFNKHLSTPYSPVMRREIAQNASFNDAYTPRPEYEFLIGSVTRDLTVFVISPVPRAKCKADSLLQFSWRWLTGPVPVGIEITDNYGRIVFKSLQIPDLSYALITKHWNRGLYYYKITSGDELVTLGSITIY